jgi:hypothetical protein
LIFKAIDKIYSLKPDEGQSEVDMIYITTVYISIIENNTGAIDQIVPLIMKRCISRMIEFTNSK